MHIFAFLEEHEDLIRWIWWIVLTVTTAWFIWNQNQKGAKPIKGSWLSNWLLVGAIYHLFELYDFPPYHWGQWTSFLLRLLLMGVTFFGQFYLMKVLVRQLPRRHKRKAAV